MSIERNVDDILSAADDSVSLINGGFWLVALFSEDTTVTSIRIKKLLARISV